MNRAHEAALPLYEPKGTGILGWHRLATQYPRPFGLTENQWWVTGFNPSGHNVSYKDIESTTTIDFSSNPGMYEAFVDSQKAVRESNWEFDPENKKATLVW